jgi:hypothetical protein
VCPTSNSENETGYVGRSCRRSEALQVVDSEAVDPLEAVAGQDPVSGLADPDGQFGGRCGARVRATNVSVLNPISP